MSPIQAPPVPSQPKKKPRPGILLWLAEKPEKRSVQIGILATLLFHLLFWLAVPRVFKPPVYQKVPHRPSKTFNMVVSDNFKKPKPPAKPVPNQFVEANPNAPENVPDKTNNFSDRNQQAAQEKPVPKSKSDRPTLEGRKDIQSNQIVDGRLAPPTPTAPIPPPQDITPTPPSVAVPKREQNPLSGVETKTGDNPTGFGSNIAPKTDNSMPIPKKIEGSKDAPLMDGQSVTSPRIDPKKPRPRQTLNVRARPAVFKDNPFGTDNIGLSGIDAKWSNYGVYLKRLTETVQVTWDAILEESKVYPQPGSMVTIKFILNSKGEIAHIVHVEATSGTSDQATMDCEAGITTRAPYGPWTDDMIAILGQEQELTFTFLYQ